jgi:hypothetical protein
MSIIHKPASSGTTNLQTLAADRAARALAVNDGLAEVSAAARHEHVVTTKPVKIPDTGTAHESLTPAAPPVPAQAVTEASVEAAIVKHREEEAPRPNMAPIIKQRVASVGAGSTRSVPHAPFVPNQPKPVKQSSVGGGQAKRPAPEPVAPPAPAEPAKPGVVTAASIAAAIAASRPAAPAPRVMATGKPRR